MINRKLKSYLIVCPSCNQERYVAYSQNWNIKSNICSGECHSCFVKNGRINKSGLALGRLWNKGLMISGMSRKHQSDKQKLKKSEMNRLFPIASIPGVREKMRLAKLGKYGELANRWEGGKTKNQKERMLAKYKEWRKAVFLRDDYTCQMCFKRGKKLNADHILSFSKYPELRTDLDNGRTLCLDCHKTTPSYCRG